MCDGILTVDGPVGSDERARLREFWRAIGDQLTQVSLSLGVERVSIELSEEGDDMKVCHQRWKREAKKLAEIRHRRLVLRVAVVSAFVLGGIIGASLAIGAMFL